MSLKRILLIVVIIAALGDAYALTKSRPEQTRKAPKAGPTREASAAAALPFYTETIQPRTLEERIIATGSIVADEAVELVSEVSGKVMSITFEEGSIVKKGDL